MAVQRRLLVLGQLAVGVGVGRVLDLVLVYGSVTPSPVWLASRQRREADLGAEHAGLEGGPLRLAGVAIQVDVGDGAELPRRPGRWPAGPARS